MIRSDPTPHSTLTQKVTMGSPGIGADELNKLDKGIMDDEEFAAVPDAVRADLDEFPNVMVQMRTVDATTDTVTIYSDVKKREDMKYLEYFADLDTTTTPPGGNVGEGPENRPGIVMTMDDGVDSTDSTPAQIADSLKSLGILTFDPGNTDGDDDAMTSTIHTSESSLFKSPAFPTAENQKYTYTDDSPGTTTDEETRGGRTLDGTFADVAGKFVCSATAVACSAENDKDGKLQKLVGTWTFVPDNAKGYVRDVVPDLDFLSFGYWVETEKEDDGSVAYAVSTFYSGSMPFGNNDEDATRGNIAIGGTDNTTAGGMLTGKATYTGEATGFYVLKTFSGEANDFVPTGS